MRCITLCATVLVVSAALAAKGTSDMPMLNWMGREKAAKATKDVVMKILREEKSLGKCCQCENVASTNANGKLGNGNIGIGNTPTMATLNKSPVLGIYDGVAYALLYNGILHDRSVNGGNVLTRQTPYDVVTRR